MNPAGKRLLLLLPVLLLAAAGGLAWYWLHDEAEVGGDGAVPSGGVVAAADEPDLPGPAPGGETGTAAAVPLQPTPATDTARPAAPKPETPLFAIGRVLADAEFDLTTLEVALLDRDGDDVETADVEDDGRFELRWGEALAGGWSLSCDGRRITVGGVRRTLMPAFAGPFEAHAPGLPPVEVELRLRFPPRIVGVVASARNGRPLQDAEISVGSTHAAYAFDDEWADTDADGRYALEVGEIPPTGVLVWCRPWDHQATVVGPFDLPESGDVVVNFLVERLRPIKGTVLDALTGEPVKGAEVTLGSSHLVFEDDEDWDFTDDKGRFELDPEDMPLEGAWIHVAGPDGYGPAALRLGGPVDDRLELRLPPVAVLEGVVRGPDGAPLHDAEILVVFSASWFGVDAGISNDALADGDGAFRIELDQALPEESRLIIEAPEHLAFEAPLLEAAHWDEAAGVYRVDVTLPREDTRWPDDPAGDAAPGG